MKHAAIAVVALMLVSGCGGNGDSSSLTGTWNFSSNSQVFGEQYSGTATIQQTGSSITGSTTLSGLACATQQASISGSVAGTNLTMQFGGYSVTTGPERDTMNFTGTLNSDYTSASGTYTTSGTCPPRRPRHLDRDPAVTLGGMRSGWLGLGASSYAHNYGMDSSFRSSSC